MKKINRAELEKLAVEKMQKESSVQGMPSRSELEQLALKKMISEQPVVPESTQGQALLEGYGQGATLGYLPQLQALAEPITDKIAALGTSLFSNEKSPSDIDKELAEKGFKIKDNENYLSRRDRNIQRNEKLKKDNPWTYGAGQVVGTIATGVATSPAQAVTATGRAAQAAGIGLLYGSLSNPGDVEGVVNELQLGDRAKNAVMGTILGFGAQVGLDKIAKYSKPLADKIRKLAEERAVRGLGAIQSDINKVGQEKAMEAGRYALDNNILKPSLWNNTKKMLSRNKDAMKKAGATMEDVAKQIDDVGASEFNPLQAASNVDDELGGFWRDPLNKGETSQFENTIETILNRGEKNIPIKEAQALKETLGKAANWDNKLVVSPKEQMARDAYKVVSKTLDDAIEASSDSIGVSGLKETFQGAKKTYGAGKTAEKFLNKRINREQGNKTFGLTDTIVGTVGAGALGGPTGLALVATKKIAEKYGNQVSAKFFDNVSKSLLKTPEMVALSTKNPSAFQALIYKTASKLEEGMGQAAIRSVESKEIKGRDKWISKGLNKVSESKGKINLADPKVIEKLLFTKEGEKLLIEASDMKPNSRGMSSVMEKIEKHLKEEK